MRSKQEIETQKTAAYDELHRIEKGQTDGSWRETKRYIEALEWVLEE